MAAYLAQRSDSLARLCVAPWGTLIKQTQAKQSRARTMMPTVTVKMNISELSCAQQAALRSASRQGMALALQWPHLYAVDSNRHGRMLPAARQMYGQA